MAADGAMQMADFCGFLAGFEARDWESPSEYPEKPLKYLHFHSIEYPYQYPNVDFNGVPEKPPRFDFLVTPGPLVITRSLVEGFPSELTAGKLSCWNITLRDAPWI